MAISARKKHLAPRPPARTSPPVPPSRKRRLLNISKTSPERAKFNHRLTCIPWIDAKQRSVSQRHLESQPELARHRASLKISEHFETAGGVPKERRRRRAEKRSPKTRKWTANQMPFLHSGTQRKDKDFSSNAPSITDLMDIRCKTFFET